MRAVRNSLLLVTGVGLAASFLPSNAAGQAPTSAAASKPPALLFVQEAAAGRLTRVKKGKYVLRLAPVSPTVSTFTDRPARKASLQPVSGFVKQWKARGFAADPPNAALVVNSAPKSSDVTMLTLSHPRYKAAGRQLVYDAKPLRGNVVGELGSLDRRGDRIRTRQFSAASLFIDDAGATTIFEPVTLQVSNAAPGQIVSIQVTPNGANVGWSTGPNFQDSAGIQVVAQSGQLPLTQMNANAQQVTFLTTASGGIGSALSFTVQIYLAADSDISTFYLRSSSDPGVQVTAAIGNSFPQAVNQTDTLFAWSLG